MKKWSYSEGLPHIGIGKYFVVLPKYWDEFKKFCPHDLEHPVIKVETDRNEVFDGWHFRSAIGVKCDNYYSRLFDDEIDLCRRALVPLEEVYWVNKLNNKNKFRLIVVGNRKPTSDSPSRFKLIIVFRIVGDDKYYEYVCDQPSYRNLFYNSLIPINEVYLNGSFYPKITYRIVENGLQIF